MNQDPLMFLEPLTASANDRLHSLIDRLKALDPLAPVTVVVPSAYALLSAHQEMGREGMANVRLMVVPRLSELLGAPALASQGLRPLTHLLESAAVRSVATDASGLLNHVKEHPSLHQSLRATFRELRHASPEVLSHLEAPGNGLRSEVVRLYRRFRRHTASYYDREALAESAADSVLSGSTPGLQDLGAIVFYLVCDLTPAERALVEALAAKWKCFVVFGMTGDNDADGKVRTLAQRLSRLLGPPQEDSSPVAPATTHLMIAHDAHEEVRWIVRHVARGAHEKVAFHRVAIFYRHAGPYAHLLREELTSAHIPVSGPGVTPLAETGVGRTLKGLIGLADGRLSREAVMEWLTGCPVSPPGLRRGDFQPSRWDAISRRAGVIAGSDQWHERLDLYAAQMERLTEEAALDDEVSEAAQARMGREARDAHSLAAFVNGLAEWVRPPGEGASWQDFAEWARALFRRYLDTRNLPSQEEDAYTRITDGLGELESLGDLESRTSLARFDLVLHEMMSSPAGRLGQFGHGVFVAPLGTALGMGFDRVYLVGMIEGAVPPRTPDDPLVPDKERRSVGAPGELPLRGVRQEEERYNYLSALASAPLRVLSFSRGDPVAQRSQHPSRWFLEEASRLHGSSVFSTSLADLGRPPWLTVVASREDGLHAVEQVAAADLHDYDLYHLWQWRAAGRSISDHHLAASDEALARALDMERRRPAGPLNQWDGDLSSLRTRAHRLQLLDRPVLSATRLQTWATCPFSYFLANVLRIAALERPEEVATISPLERGVLIHSILERFVRQVQQQDSVPDPGQPWAQEHQALLHQIAQESFAEAKARGITGKRLLWELEQSAILTDLDGFIEEDTLLRSRYGVAPHRVEFRFGFDGNGAEAATPPATWISPSLGAIRFRGIIDRMDVDREGRQALVLDYKTGVATPYRGLEQHPVDRGRRLQLPIYALAARQALGEQVHVRSAFWFITARGGFSMVPSQPVDMGDLEESFGEAVSVIARGVLQGLFPANPGGEDRGVFENCRFCDFNSLCPTRRDVYWERKQRDPRLADYVRLSTGVHPPRNGP